MRRQIAAAGPEPSGRTIAKIGLPVKNKLLGQDKFGREKFEIRKFTGDSEQVSG